MVPVCLTGAKNIVVAECNNFVGNNKVFCLIVNWYNTSLKNNKVINIPKYPPPQKKIYIKSSSTGFELCYSIYHDIDDF